VVGDGVALLQHALPVVTPVTGDLLQHVLEAALPVPGKVRSGDEWLEGLGLQPDRHGPPAAAGLRLDGGHVDVVDVRPLLAVELDAHEVLVHDRGRRLVLEALPLHDMAPVARRVAHAQEDQPVELPRRLERLRTPREPVHRVVLVLQQVGARLVGEPVTQLDRRRVRIRRGRGRLRGRHVFGLWLGGGGRRGLSRRGRRLGAAAAATENEHKESQRGEDRQDMAHENMLA
jgi:hypothetical protein